MMTDMLDRTYLLRYLERPFKVSPVIALLGPKQCGKTTIARDYVSFFKEQNRLDPENIHYFDLEDPIDLARLENPMLTLASCHGLIVIDEIQRRPELFQILRVLVDKNRRARLDTRYLILGSASRELIQQSSESLAGRIQYVEMSPLGFNEEVEAETLWHRGGFPESYLALDDAASTLWRKAYITTFVEQDIPNLGYSIPAKTMRRFWAMLAHYHAQVVNFEEINQSLGLSNISIRRYLDILQGAFMIELLAPWHANIKKRQVKHPKLYFRDTGLLHTMLNIEGKSALETHPKIGASWEGFVIEHILRQHRLKTTFFNEDSYFFWAAHQGGEMDLLLLIDNKKIGIEVKYQDAPTLTKSMRTAQDELGLDEIIVIYPGDRCYQLADNIQVMGLEAYIRTI